METLEKTTREKQDIGVSITNIFGERNEANNGGLTDFP